jgi:tryptophan synthase beta chain
VRDFQAVIGKEARAQFKKRYGELPAAVVACVGGGSNAMGIFHAFVTDKKVELIGVEPGGRGLATGEHGATLVAGTPGLLHGARTFVLQDEEGQILEPHSVSAGLDYPGVGPEHAFLKASGRARYVAITDDEALDAFERLSELEGIIPAFEPSHALAYLLKAVGSGELESGSRVLVNLCGRGDKDLDTYFTRFADRRRRAS